MAIIPDKVIWDEYRDAQNAIGGSVTNELKRGYDEGAKINYRSRFKPVPWPEDFPSSEYWWRAKIEGDPYATGRCGVDFPTYTSTADLVGNTDMRPLWKHKFPTGGTAQPYRTDDLIGYDTNARDFINYVSVNPDGDVAYGDSGMQSNCMVIFNENHDTTALDYSEIRFRDNQEYLNDFYYGVIAISEGGYSHGCVSLPYTLRVLNDTTEGDYYAQDDHRAYVILNTGVFNAVGEWDIYPVLFQNPQEATAVTNETISCGNYIPLPVKPIRVNVVNYAAKLTAQPVKVELISGSEQMGVEVRVTIRIKNDNEGITYTFDGTNQYVEAGIARYYEFVDGGGEYVYMRYTGAEFSIPGGTSKDVEIVVSNSEIKPSDKWLLVASRIKFREDIITREGFPLSMD